MSDESTCEICGIKDDTVVWWSGMYQHAQGFGCVQALKRVNERLRAALALFGDEANWESIDVTPLDAFRRKNRKYYWDHETITAPWTVAEEVLK